MGLQRSEVRRTDGYRHLLGVVYRRTFKVHLREREEDEEDKKTDGPSKKGEHVRICEK